ncbi:MAG: AAA family ATPase [Myxococcota bacterium]
MFIVAVVNLKGGCGKTTLATQLAARFAREGHRSILGDCDRQQSAIQWAARRPGSLPEVEAVDLDTDAMVVPFGDGRMVIDVPAGLKRKALEVVVRAADALVVPVLPSVFDADGTARLVRMLGEMKPVRKGRRPVGVVANRVRPRSVSARQLEAFCGALEVPTVARLSDAQHYVNAAATGVTLFDLPPGRETRLRREWAPLLTFLDALSAGTDDAEAAAG